MSKLFETLSFSHGPGMKNRFMLAPLTNTQSHADGVLSDEEFNWLTMRAKCGFGGSTRCPGGVRVYVPRQHLWNRYSTGLKESFCSS
ncbi:MAG: hypothetical protein QGH99_11015 [Pseudomonadales bacterium]|nr:hypothetical protein [Pseudomonadales bacterium]